MSRKSHQYVLPGFGDDADAASVQADSAAEPLLAPPTPSVDRTVYVVDSHSLIYQVFHALPEMSSPSGQPVGAVHGFIRDLVDLLERKQPNYLFCAFDLPGPTFRDALYDQYKADRAEMPDALRPQFPQIRRMLEAMGVPILECPGYEADDVLATLAKQAEQQGLLCYLVTNDKDCRQLITDRVRVYNIRKDEVFDATALQAEWGVRPDQVVDFQSLVGDSVDNVPGIASIGPKTARELLAQYQTLEGVLEHAAEVTNAKRREHLLQGRDVALLSRQLVRLVDNVPVTVDWEAGRPRRFDRQRVLELSQEFGFRRLAERLERLATVDAGATTAVSPAWAADYRTVSTLAELQELVRELSSQRRVSVDTETTSTNPRFAELVGYSFAWREGLAYYVPVRAPAGDPQLDPETVRAVLQPVLENPQIKKIGQNIKYDMVVLRGAGIQLCGAGFDTMVADYLIDPGERNHNLDDLAKRFLDHATIKIGALIGTGKNQQRMDQVPVALVTPYAAEDADVALRLAGILEQRLEQAGLTALFQQLEMPLIEVLAELEFNGIKVDVPRLTELGQRFGQRMEALQGEIYELAGEPFNIDSRNQLADVLFRKLGLPITKKTKTGPSTDAAVLEDLAPQHPLPAKIIEYRQFAKLKNTYVDGLIALVHPRTGRVHTSFKQDVTATGRLSSTEPNLQNIPIRTETGREIRSAFLPGEPGWKLLTADYSQIELRVLAHCSADAALQQAFAEDQDIHARVAGEVYGVSLADVTREMRRSAKAVNFGVIYGQSPFGLAKALGIDQDQAAQFIEAYFARYPGVKEFMARTLAECRRTGYVNTILGRRRAVQGVRDPSSLGDSSQRNLPERIAINTVIQGSAADLIKKAMVHVYQRMRCARLQARMLLQIHDELVFEVPPHELDQLAALVGQEMTSVERLSVPLKVDLKVGVNWAECEVWS
ncbi:MAG: DNA polymerase I [Planctomycetota bacterium]|nr:DNA polymerase I [Planctomycetota bacterium]